MTAPDSAPQPFGKYLLVERLATGGMAEIYRAVLRGEAGFEKQVAVKRILPIFGTEADFVTLFKDEARIASTLNHANLVQTFDFGEVGGSYYLALELVEGTDLSRLVERLAREGQPFPAATAAFVVAEAARGLGYAHDKKASDGTPLEIIHRDVSPQNILLSYAGEVKVADFGIAKAASKVHRTMTGMVMGKLRYMSPEQVGGEPLDGRTDVFSLGVILYELLTGGPLFPESGARVAELIHAAPIVPPAERTPGVAKELSDIVMKALGRPRERRYAKAAELARDLTVWIAQAAPTFTREDLAALVARMAPPGGRRPTATLVEAGADGDAELEVVPAAAPAPDATAAMRPSSASKRSVITPAPVRGVVDPRAATELREMDVPTRTRVPDEAQATAGEPEAAAPPRTMTDAAGPSARRQRERDLDDGEPPPTRKRRGLSATTWIGLVLLGVIVGSGALVLVRFVLPGTESAGGGGPLAAADAGEALVVAADAAVVAEEPADAGAATAVTAFQLTPTVTVEKEKQRLAEGLERWQVLRRGVADVDYELVLTAVDWSLARLPLDATGRAGAAPPLPDWLKTQLEERGHERAVAGLVDYVRKTGELPPLVREAARSFLHRRLAFPLRPSTPYGAATLALWLADADTRPARLLELARQLTAHGSPCPPGGRRFVAEACDPAALAAALDAAGEQDVAAAIRRWGEAADSAAGVSVRVSAWAEASPDQRLLHLELAAPGPLDRPTLACAGVDDLLPARPAPTVDDATGSAVTVIEFLVPSSAFACVVAFELDGAPVALRTRG